MVKIAHASIDENGKTVGGLAGDQTGREVCIREWYSKPWNCVIRFKDSEMRKRVADCMEKACNNPHIGYDQTQRNTLLAYARNVGYNPSLITAFCETDCSALVTLACIYAGIKESALVKNGNSATTRTLRGCLEATGAVETFTGGEYTQRTEKLVVGDILLSEGHHVAVVVGTGAVVPEKKVARKNLMNVSQKGIDLIKQFEGCRLQAYKAVPSEQCYTIGYGHYGSDVLPGMVISQAQAEALLAQDLIRYENAVIDTGLSLNQNQFDALVSFAYNCGAGNLKKLVRGRDTQQIADAMLLYNKSGGQVLAGLTRRRQAERALFMTGSVEKKTGNPYPEPTKAVKMNSKGNDVRWVQYELNRHGYKLVVDGIAKNLTIGAILDFQKKHPPLVVDGICGTLTRAALKL